MFRKSRFILAVMCFAVVLAGVCSGKPVKKQEACVMVIPTRYTVVQFCFDVARIRPVTLIAYDIASDKKSPVMHVWDKNIGDWVQTSVAEFGQGTAIGVDAKKVILVGDSKSLPDSIVKAAAWAPEIVKIESLSIMKIANTIGKPMKFKSSEWKWLAKRHRLKIVDSNSDRRRYGKYGKPGSKSKKRSIKKDDKVPMPDETENAVSLLPAEIEMMELEKKVLTPVRIDDDIAPEDK